MNNRKKSYYLLATIALAGQFLGLVFCGDADCLQGGADTNCATLVCGLLGSHSTTDPTSDDGPNNPCQCFCHLLIDLPKITLHAVALGITHFHTTEASHFFSSPIHDIYHPPLA